jgi:hypothetical protein
MTWVSYQIEMRLMHYWLKTILENELVCIAFGQVSYGISPKKLTRKIGSFYLAKRKPQSILGRWLVSMLMIQRLLTHSTIEKKLSG